MNKRFRVCSLDQPYLLPPSLEDWLLQNHLARFIAEISDELDLSSIYSAYERRDNRGASAYHPLLLVRLMLYGYMIGITSSRRIERETYDDVAFRFLAANQHPDHDTLASFRMEHLKALAGLFVQALRLCQKAGLVKLGKVAIDGTKMLANASASHSVPYRRLTDREQYWKETVDQLLNEAVRTDAEEDARWGKGKIPQDLPEELADAQKRLERIRKAKRELEQEAQQRLKEAEKNYPGPGKPGRPAKETAAAKGNVDREAKARAKLRLRAARRNAKHPRRQYNFVDPDSRVMFDSARHTFVQATTHRLRWMARRR